MEDQRDGTFDGTIEHVLVYGGQNFTNLCLRNISGSWRVLLCTSGQATCPWAWEIVVDVRNTYACRDSYRRLCQLLIHNYLRATLIEVTPSIWTGLRFCGLLSLYIFLGSIPRNGFFSLT